MAERLDNQTLLLTCTPCDGTHRIVQSSLTRQPDAPQSCHLVYVMMHVRRWPPQTFWGRLQPRFQGASGGTMVVRPHTCEPTLTYSQQHLSNRSSARYIYSHWWRSQHSAATTACLTEFCANAALGWHSHVVISAPELSKMHCTAVAEQSIHGRHVLNTLASDRGTTHSPCGRAVLESRGSPAQVGGYRGTPPSDGRGTHECMAVASKVQVARSPRRANGAGRCPRL